MRRYKRRRVNSVVETKENVDRPAVDTKPFVLRYCQDSQLGTQTPNQLRSQAKEHFFERQISVLQERELPCGDWKFDKAFASEWINQTEVVVATKCNRLLRVDVDRCSVTPISLPGEARSNHGRHGERGICGIHSIAINPSRTCVATGAQDPAHCAVLNLRDFSVEQMFVGHEDWIFGIDWVTDIHLVTGSRDKTIQLWKMDPNKGLQITESCASRRVHKDKVRDIKYSREAHRVVSVSTDGDVKVFDPESLRGIHGTALAREHNAEIACLSCQGTQVAVGSRDYIVMLDMRVKHEYTEIKLIPTDYSVRSVRFQDNILSCGSGNGWVSFFDLRQKDYLDLKRPRCRGSNFQMENHLEVGKGWLDTEGFYREYFDGMIVNNAVYSHCWDAARSRLFACGGPLPMGLRGCYMGVWE